MNVVDDPVSTLAEIKRVRRRTRAGLYLAWYPLILYGVASLGAAAVAAADVRWVGAYWLLAYVACFAAVRRHARARAERVGVGGTPDKWSIRLWLAFPLVLFVAANVAVNLGGLPAAVAATSAVVGAWYLLVAWWERSALMAVLGVAVTAVGVVLAAVDPARIVAAANLAIGAVLVAGGLVARSRAEVP